MISRDKLQQIIRIVNNRTRHTSGLRTGKGADPVLVWLETVDACRFLRVREKHIQEVYENVASQLE